MWGGWIQADPEPPRTRCGPDPPAQPRAGRRPYGTRPVRLSQHLLLGQTSHSARPRHRRHRGNVPDLFCRPPGPPNLGRGTRRAGGRAAAPSPRCPWRDAASAPPVVSGALGGRGGAAGSSVAPKSGSPTSGAVLIFPSSVLPLKSFRLLKYFSIPLNVRRLIPRARVSRGGTAAPRGDGDSAGHPDAGPEVSPGGQVSLGPRVRGRTGSAVGRGSERTPRSGSPREHPAPVPGPTRTKPGGRQMPGRAAPALTSEVPPGPSWLGVGCPVSPASASGAAGGAGAARAGAGARPPQAERG